MKENLHELFPEIEPYKTGRLKVSGLHEIYFEECGNPKGEPVVFLHGGPGGGISIKNRRYFDPQFYRIILLDQRGSGKSTPHAELKENTTWDLVSDIEKLRESLQIKKWHVFGGSWGSTLSLAYAETHPEIVKSLCLRGIFLCRKKEIDWFYQKGTSFLFPDFWEPYKNHIPENERNDFVKAYYKRLTSTDKKVQLDAARIWSVWEGSTSKLIPDDDLMHDFEDPEFALAFARIECHYFTHNAFFETDNWLIENAFKIKNIPTEIVHGRYDVVCPIENAWELKQALPQATLHIVPNAGHSATEVGIIDKLIQITEKFKSIK
ncbi:MAG: prolyl aminopeptidase [Bdellovibrionales bacterium]